MSPATISAIGSVTGKRCHSVSPVAKVWNIELPMWRAECESTVAPTAGAPASAASRRRARISKRATVHQQVAHPSQS